MSRSWLLQQFYNIMGVPKDPPKFSEVDDLSQAEDGSEGKDYWPGTGTFMRLLTPSLGDAGAREK